MECLRTASDVTAMFTQRADAYMARVRAVLLSDDMRIGSQRAFTTLQSLLSGAIPQRLAYRGRFGPLVEPGSTYFLSSVRELVLHGRYGMLELLARAPSACGVFPVGHALQLRLEMFADKAVGSASHLGAAHYFNNGDALAKDIGRLLEMGADPNFAGDGCYVPNYEVRERLMRPPLVYLATLVQEASGRAARNAIVDVIKMFLSTPGINVNAHGSHLETALFMLFVRPEGANVFTPNTEATKLEVLQLLLAVPNVDVNKSPGCQTEHGRQSPLIAALCACSHTGPYRHNASRHPDFALRRQMVDLLLDHPNIMAAGTPIDLEDDDDAYGERLEDSPLSVVCSRNFYGPTDRKGRSTGPNEVAVDFAKKLCARGGLEEDHSKYVWRHKDPLFELISARANHRVDDLTAYCLLRTLQKGGADLDLRSGTARVNGDEHTRDFSADMLPWAGPVRVTPLVHACMSNTTGGFARMLLEAGADADHVVTKSCHGKAVPVCHAITACCIYPGTTPRTFRAVVNASEDVNHVDSASCTPLMWVLLGFGAGHARVSELVHFSLEQGMNPFIKCTVNLVDCSEAVWHERRKNGTVAMCRHYQPPFRSSFNRRILKNLTLTLRIHPTDLGSLQAGEYQWSPLEFARVLRKHPCLFRGSHKNFPAFPGKAHTRACDSMAAVVKTIAHPRWAYWTRQCHSAASASLRHAVFVVHLTAERHDRDATLSLPRLPAELWCEVLKYLRAPDFTRCAAAEHQDVAFTEDLFKSHFPDQNIDQLPAGAAYEMSEDMYRDFTTNLFHYPGKTAYRRAQNQCASMWLSGSGSLSALRRRIAAEHRRRIDAGWFGDYPPPFAIWLA